MIILLTLLLNMTTEAKKTFPKTASVGQVATKCPCKKSSERLTELQQQRAELAEASQGIGIGSKGDQVKHLQKMVGHRQRGTFSAENAKRLNKKLANLDRQIRTEQNWQDAKPRLTDAANTAGIDPQVLVRISFFESRFNPDARPVSTSKPALNTVTQFDGTKAMSSAHGYGQFLDKTWKGMLQKHGSKYGVENAATLTDEQAKALRGDKDLQAGMLAEFTKENAEIGKKLGGPDPNANVYALHNLGTGDGKAFLKKLKESPDTPIDEVLDEDVIKRNSSLYGDGSITLKEAYERMGKKMQEGDPYACELEKAPVPAAPPPVIPNPATPTILA